MKLIIQSKSIIQSIVLIILLLLYSFPNTILYAKQNVRPLRIISKQQIFDIKKNMIIFSDHVTVEHGFNSIQAEKVVVYNFGQKNSSEIIESYGRPIFFNGKKSDNYYFSGNAKKIRYDTKKKQ